ncbi:hypothetical protein ABZ733_16120 [Streptomyces longwoodensis]|uniref:hypothetical protein n=1 Tax=Streptomyces longwoodensis TaxID=68231 RepID=UPI0033F61990
MAHLHTDRTGTTVASTFRTRAVLSLPQLTIVLPPGVKGTPVTSALCPSSGSPTLRGKFTDG